MGATFRTGTISVIYKFNYTNLGYRIYTTILKNHMQKTLVKTNQLLPKIEHYYTFSMIRDVIDVPYKSHLALISLNFRELFTE